MSNKQNIGENMIDQKVVDKITKYDLLFESILRQDIAFFDKNTPGEINSVVIRYYLLK